MQIRGSSVPDKNGSPMILSVIINYQVVDAVKYIYMVDHPDTFLYNQALLVVRSVSSRFAYRSTKEPCLMSDGKLIGLCMKQLVQANTNIIGVEIVNMEIMEVSYAPEVAQSLLLVQ